MGVRTREQAESLGIPLTTLDDLSSSGSGGGGRAVDVAIDGADSVDPSKQLVKTKKMTTQNIT